MCFVCQKASFLKAIFFGQLAQGLISHGLPVKSYEDWLKTALKECSIDPNSWETAALKELSIDPTLVRRQH